MTESGTDHFKSDQPASHIPGRHATTSEVSLAVDESETPRFTSWWDRYSLSLKNSGFTDTALSVVEDDSRFIVNKCIFGAGEPGAKDWPEGRVRQGLVMGAVQSGKTASMIGVTALALDAGVDAVILLSGTRTSLWAQTYQRVAAQLGLTDALVGQIPISERPIFKPEAYTFEYGELPRASQNLYEFQRGMTRRMKPSGSKPLFIIAMKNTVHLQSIARMIKEDFAPAVAKSDKLAHILVLDDEADDGSILDADSEHDFASEKQIPRAIVDLWADRDAIDVTRNTNLFCTYVAYTATPQANFLQADQNPLAPKHFVAALRTPYDKGELEPRELTYTEPKGLPSFYTGGDTFYGRLAKLPICEKLDGNPTADTSRAIRCFLLAGAIKVMGAPNSSRPSELTGKSFTTLDEAKKTSPDPHTMLIHTSAEVSQHFEIAETLLATAFNADHEVSRRFASDSSNGFPSEVLEEDLTNNEEKWLEELTKFGKRSDGVQNEFNMPERPFCPTLQDWNEIRTTLLEEVAPFVRLSVINSDEEADEHPNFDPVSDDGVWRPRDPLFAIYVSGNVMSRGLTLEGLTTTVFTRSPGSQVADTKMQMQRWFGYRGKNVHLTQVFLEESQRTKFEQFHDADVYLRNEILAEMQKAGSSGKAPDPNVLAGHEWFATQKIQNLPTEPLCAGSYPLIRFTNRSSNTGDPNIEVVANLFTQHSYSLIKIPNRRPEEVGLIIDEPFDLMESADILDSLAYDSYIPHNDQWTARRWQSLSSVIFAGEEPNRVEFYRPPNAEPGVKTHDPRHHCPYSIAAYFRLWQACTTRRVKGLYDSRRPQGSWSLVDLPSKVANAPKFYVGIRFGSGEPIKEGPLSSLSYEIKPMKRQMDGDWLHDNEWGTQNPDSRPGSYRGDRWFDYHLHGYPEERDPYMKGWRPEGAPGQILFHINQVEGRGKNKLVVAVGLSIPVGGPDQIAARSRGANG